MGAIDKKAARFDRRQFASDMGHPISVRHFRDHEPRRPVDSSQEIQLHTVRTFEKISTHFPGLRSILDFKYANPCGRGFQRFESFAQGLGIGLVGHFGIGGECDHGHLLL